MLLMTDVEIDLMTDPEMYSFMFDNIRGGITTIAHRRAKANNPYLVDYNQSLPTSYILYLVRFFYLSSLDLFSLLHLLIVTNELFPGHK